MIRLSWPIRIVPTGASSLGYTASRTFILWIVMMLAGATGSHEVLAIG